MRPRQSGGQNDGRAMHAVAGEGPLSTQGGFANYHREK